MKGLEQAVRDLLVETEFVMNNSDVGDWPELEKAHRDLMREFATYNDPDHICPLCGQAKQQTALLELLASLKSCEVWADDGQSWTINVANCEGDLDKVVGLMLSVTRGEYTLGDEE